MAIDWGRWETVSVDRGGERLDFTFCPESEGGWRLGVWARLARKESGDWQPVESWNRLYSRDAWEPELPEDALAALRARLARRRSVRAMRELGGAAAVIGIVCVAWGVWAYLI
jgi:hypothetical protein